MSGSRRPLRAIAVVALALAGSLLGAVVGLVLPGFTYAVLTGQGLGPGLNKLAMLIGLWLGLVGGIWFGIHITSRQPNREVRGG
jgi:hypothetical protein